MKSSAKKVELASVDDLFSTEESRADAQREKVVEIPLSELHPFKGHPFKVKDDEAMMETADSIKQYGVLVPAIARPDPEGGYELVAGHRRHRASELAEKETMPVIVRDLDDDAATIIMVDSNLQRESLLPSERAFAYKMKLDAMKHQGERVDLTSSQVGTKLRADEILAQQAGSSRNQVQRYIRLTELIPELMDMVDEKKIALNPAYELSLGKIDNSLGIHHAVEKKKNWFLMTASFALTIMLVFSFSVILDFAKQLVPSLSVTSADIALSSYANKMDIERSLVDEIKKIDGVANAYGSSYVENIPATSSRAGIDHINIVSYDDTLLDYSKGSIAQGSLDTVYGNSNKVATVFNRNNPLHIGDTIQFAGEEVEITCALSQGLFGDDLIIICSQETFDRIMGGTKYGLIGIQLDSNATEETIAEIRSLENDDIIITDQREGNKQNNATYWAARIVCYGFLAIIGVISLFNIVNSISMSVSARIKQYGAMRAVGMDNRQLKRMISAEAYTYAISGLIVGCGIGLPLSRFLYNRLITHYFGIEWRFPILWFGIVVAFIFISAIVSVYAPAKRIRNMPITATINEL